ncbi:MAG: ATP-binding protein [Acidobacteriota bacterium]|nr:ATP-binding protein [Acidobacteriota bacterium]
MSRFTVDTHLFRELGELLVGRDSTALVELVKNAYDADATRVTIHAEGLDDPTSGFIQVRDNGLGMTGKQFEEGFLRIASRIKEDGPRVSPRLGRRYTGAKGIGRLAAHKLAKILEVQSVALDPRTLRPQEAFNATIDWRLVEQATTLDEVATDAVKVTPFKPSATAGGGTVLILRQLRRGWTEQERRQFVSEAQSTKPPDFLISRTAGRLLEETLLFDEIHSYSTASFADWKIELTGELDVGDEYLEIVADAASWVLEVDASDAFPRFGIAPTRRYADHHPDAKATVRALPQASPEGYPRFQARVLIREGDWDVAGTAVKQWRRSASGVRVYLEGFRVLPYAEPGNDWLELDRSYAARERKDPLTQGLFDDIEKLDKDWMLGVLPSKSYFGGAFLTLTSAPGLQVLVNREGFLPNAHLFHIQSILKTATAFATRVRSAAKLAPREQRHRSRIESAAKKHAELKRQETPAQDLERAAQSGTLLLREARIALAAGNSETAKEHVAAAEKALASTPDLAREIRDQQAMVYVLASLGLQTAAFVHEIHGLLGLAQAVERSLSQLADELQFTDRSSRQKLARTTTAVEELKLALERQAAYLTDIAGVNARRRRSRQPLSERFQSAVNLVAHHAERWHIQIDNQIPDDLKSPPMFRAELTAIFSNLLTNAIKAAGDNGHISATAVRGNEGKVMVRLENTGMTVDPDAGEVWFRPFTSSTADVDPALGKGMGLGLPITRRVLEEYGAEIGFGTPQEGFAACIEILFPE